MTLEELLSGALQAKIEMSGAMEGVGARRRETKLTALEQTAVQNLFKQLNKEGAAPASRRGKAIEKQLTGEAGWLSDFVGFVRADPSAKRMPSQPTEEKGRYGDTGWRWNPDWSTGRMFTSGEYPTPVISDPSAKRMGTVQSFPPTAPRAPAAPPPVAGMSIDELIAEAKELYGVDPQTELRTGVTGIAGDSNLERAIAVGNMLKTKAESEIKRIKALPPPPPKGSRKIYLERAADLAELDEILTGKRKEKGKAFWAIDYPWSDKGLEGTVQQSTDRVAEIGREEVKAAGEATRAKGFDAFIEQVAVADPELQNKIRLAQGFNEKGEPLPRMRGVVVPPAGRGEEYVSARADLAALTKVFDDAMAGKPISTEGMPIGIPEFFATTAGKAAFEQAKSVGVEPPAPAPAAAPPRPMTADEEAFLEAAGLAPEDAAAAAPTAAAPTAAAPTAAAAAAAAPTAAAAQPIVVAPTGDAIGAAAQPPPTVKFLPGDPAGRGWTGFLGGQDPLWEAPYRTNLEEAYRQAAYIYYQDKYERFGEAGTDPSLISKERTDAFKAMIEQAFTAAGFLTTPTSEEKMAFLEVHWLNQDQGDPPEGVQHDYENIEQTKLAVRGSRAYTNLYGTISDDLDSISDEEGLTKRFSRTQPPDALLLRHELDKVFKVGKGAGVSRKDWVTDKANKMWADIARFEKKIANPEGVPIEDLWGIVMPYVEAEANREPEEVEAEFDTFKRKKLGMLNINTVRSKLVDTLTKSGIYDQLPTGLELENWLELEALRIHTKTQGVYDVQDDDGAYNIAGADEEMARLIELVVEKPLNDLLEEMKATPEKIIEDWLDKHPSNKDLKANEKARLVAGAQSFYDAWIDDVETDLTFKEWMNVEGAGVRGDIADEQELIASGRDEKAGVKQWFLSKAISAGKYTKTASPELRQAMSDKFEEYWAQVQNWLIPVEGEPAIGQNEAQDIVMKDFMPGITDSSEWQREFDDKKAQDERNRVAALKPRLSTEEAFGQATERLEERVGGPTLDADIMETRKNRGRLEQDILDFQGNKFDYYADGVGITQAEFEAQHQPALDTMVKEDGSPDDARRKEYLSSLGITTYAEQLGQMNQNLKNLESDEGKFQSQLDQSEYDKEISTMMMDSPELSQAFASGSVDGLESIARNLQIPEHLVTHLLQKQLLGGHVLTESEKQFRIAAGLPLPAESFAAQRESAIKRDADLMRQQMRTTQFEATGEERAFTTPDWEKLGYDPTTMTRTGPLTGTAMGMAGRGRVTVNIPGTNFADTPENREVLREQIAQGYQYKTYAPREEEEDDEEITPRSPHEVDDITEEEAKEQAQFRIEQIGGGLGA